MSCLVDLDLLVLQHCCSAATAESPVSNCTSFTLSQSWLLLFLYVLICSAVIFLLLLSNSAIHCLFYFNLLCCPSFLYLLYLSLPQFFSHSIFFSYCLSPHISAAILIALCPLCHFLCAPDLLSLCLITKSTGSSRRSCRRSSPSVRSSLTRVRGTSWHGDIFVCMDLFVLVLIILF